MDGQFGGRITFNFAGQYLPPTDASITLDPSALSVEGKANHDGSPCYILKNELPGAEVRLRHKDGVDWNALMLVVGNCTIEEENNGRTHLFTGTRFVGKPKVDLSTGEVSGLSVMGGKYTRIDS